MGVNLGGSVGNQMRIYHFAKSILTTPSDLFTFSGTSFTSMRIFNMFCTLDQADATTGPARIFLGTKRTNTNPNEIVYRYNNIKVYPGITTYLADKDQPWHISSGDDATGSPYYIYGYRTGQAAYTFTLHIFAEVYS